MEQTEDIELSNVAQVGFNEPRYTCPMHPEIVSIGPSDCPMCGMSLEPMDISASTQEPDTELDEFTHRFWLSTACAIPIMILTMGPMVGLHVRHWFGETLSLWLEFLLATPVVLWAALPFFKRGWQSLCNRSPNMWTLISLGVAASYGFSVVALVAPEVFPESFRTTDGHVPVYFEAATVIIALVFLGQVLELRARKRTGSAIRALMDLTPTTVRRITVDGSDEEIGLDKVLKGDKIRVRPGERVPVDGPVVEGRSTIDESMITGEALPVQKCEGDVLTGGTLNKNGSLVMVAERVGSETMVAQIVEMVSQAQRSRAPIQSMADRVAAWFVPLVIICAIAAFIVWALFGPEPSMIFAIVSAVSVLIIACPCALGLATPMSIVTAIGRGAQSGVLIKDAEALERFANINTLVVDKTGTLTEGNPTVTDVLSVPGINTDQLLVMAASLERGSEHPLAEAIVCAATETGSVLENATNFVSVAGKGVSGQVRAQQVVLGNRAMMQELDVDTNSMSKETDKLRSAGKTVMFVAINKHLAGIVAVADPIKLTTADAIRSLQNEDIQIIMATGDNEKTAISVGQSLHINDVRAGLLPEDKKLIVEELRAKGAKIAMVGDGVNDAPALAAADVSIAMGTGADVTIESAGITLLKGDLNGIVRARKLASATIRNIKQNLFFAFIYNGIGVPIAAGVLYPVLGVLLSPMLAAAAMSLSSVSVIVNALRLRNLKL